MPKVMRWWNLSTSVAIFRAFARTKNGNFLMASCLEWKSDQVGAHVRMLFNDFGMDGILQHDYGC
jgi:hypothetical protein